MTSNRYELTIYVPTYNRHDKLKYCLDIISREIIGFEDRVLVFVSNNGSSDGTRAYLESLDHTWLRIRHNEENVGSTQNILYCFNLPFETEFVWPVGDDDYLMPNSLSGILSIIHRYPTADYIFCNTTAFRHQQSTEILKKYLATGSIEGGIPKSRKYTGTTLVDFEQLIDPDIADTLLGELMVHCFRQSSIQFDIKELTGLNPDTADWDNLDFESAGKLTHPHTLPFLRCFTAKTKAVYCDVPRTFNFWGSAGWLVNYDHIFPIGLLFLISQYKERGFISDEKLINLLNYYYSIMRGPLTRQINGQSTARPFNPKIKAIMYEFLFQYMNKQFMSPPTEADKPLKPLIEATPKAIKSDSNTGIPDPEAPLASIIILTHKQLDLTKLCLESIEAHTPESHEIIIVDNASTDGTLDYLRRYESAHSNVHVIANKENLGFAGGNNQGLALSRGEYVLLLNNDTVVTDGWLSRMLATLKNHPEAGLVGPMSNFVSGPQLISEVPYKNMEQMHQFAKQIAEKNSGQTAESFRLVGFCLMARRAVIDRIGGLDERFGSGNFEDDDFCVRAAIAGFKSLIAKDVFIHHVGGQTFQALNINYKRSLERNWDIFKSKWNIPATIPCGSVYTISWDTRDQSRYYIPLTSGGLSSAIPTDLNAGGNHSSPHRPAAAEAVNPQEPSGQRERQNSAIRGIFSAEPESIIPPLTKSEFDKGLISIIIPVHSGDLHACVSSLRKHTKEAHEVIFVDRGAAPGVKKWLTKAVKDNHHFQLLEYDQETNLVQSLNTGINQSKGEYIVLLFDDVVVDEGWLPDMLGFLHSSENTGIVGPMSDTASGMQRAEGFNSTSKEERISFRERNRHRRMYVRYLEGFCLLFRRSLLSSIDLLDEAFGADKHVFDDFCVRSVLKGYRNVIAGNVFVHNGGGIHGLMSRDRTFFDEKWRGLEASSSLAEKVLTVNAMETARSLFNKGSVDDAVKILIGRIGFSPHENKLYYLLAEMLIEEKKFQDALGALKEMAVVEGDAEYHEALGYGHEGLALYREAKEHADMALAINGRSAPALNLKGILAYRKGETENAEEQFLLALEADPGYGEPYTNLGMLKWLAGDQEGALDLFEKGFILSPDRCDVCTAYYDAVNILDLHGRAEPIFSEARSAYPENMRILFLLIDLLLKQDKHQEAMKLVERAMVHQGMDEGILAAALEIRKKIGPKIIEKAKYSKTKSAPSLSVCMIVKNEEKHLAYCLNSLTPVADEMIVVDTGSTDKTKVIAEAFGARIFDFEWINDFSAARNHSLSQAQGDWILVMDADEVISGQDYAKLKKLLHKKKESAYILATRNYVHRTAGDGWVCNDNSYIYEQAGRGWFPSTKVRLFPNNKNIRFEQPIHELVEYSLQKIGMGAKESGVPVHHYGELDATKATAKDEQYYALGLKKMKESGGDFKSVWELAVQAGELGKFEESIELWHKVIGFKHREAAAYFNLANHYLNLGRYEESHECSRKAYALDPRDQSSVLSFATAEFLAGDLNKAISALEGYLQGSDAQTSHAALLAVSYLLTGKTDEGLNLIRRGVKKGYNMVHYLQQQSQSLLTAGNRKRAISLLTTAIDMKYYTPQMQTLLDECRADA